MKRSTQQKFVDACLNGTVTYVVCTVQSMMKQDLYRYYKYKMDKSNTKFTAVYESGIKSILLREYVVDETASPALQQVVTRFVVPIRYSKIYRLDGLWVHIDHHKMIRVYSIEEGT